MRLILAGILYLFGSALALRSVTFAGCMFLWNDIFRPLDFAKMGGAYPTAQYVFAVLIAAYLLHWARGKFKPILGGYAFLLAGYILWILFTALVSPFRAEGIDQFVIYLKYLLPLLLIYSSIRTVQDVKYLVAILCVSVGIWGAYSGIHCLIKGPTTDLGIPGGQMAERNEFAAGIVSTIPMWIYYLFSYTWKFRVAVRSLCLVIAILSVIAVLLSLSRGASIGLFVSLLAYLGFVSKKKIRDGILALTVAGLGLLLAPEAWYARMQTIEIGTEQTEGSAMERMDSMHGALLATLDRPITGWGPDGWFKVAKFYSKTENNPHSIYLKISSETGLVGLMFFLGLMLFTYFQVKSVVDLAGRHGDKDAGRLAMALATGLLGYLAASTFLNSPLHELLWSWITVANGFAVIYPRVLRGRRAGARPARPVPPLFPSAPGPAAAGAPA